MRIRKRMGLLRERMRRVWKGLCDKRVRARRAGVGSSRRKSLGLGPWRPLEEASSEFPMGGTT